MMVSEWQACLRRSRIIGRRGQNWCFDELGSEMRLHYSLTRYVGVKRTLGILGGRTCRRGDDGLPLASSVFPGSP
jgi:hypothetical protein